MRKFVDVSGWQPVYELLVRDGYHVSIVQQQLTALQDDVTAEGAPYGAREVSLRSIDRDVNPAQTRPIEELRSCAF
jgi:hypothetical protein